MGNGRAKNEWEGGKANVGGGGEGGGGRGEVKLETKKEGRRGGGEEGSEGGGGWRHESKIGSILNKHCIFEQQRINTT